VSHIVDALVDVAPANRDGGPDYQWINKKVLGFVKSLRTFDINVVLIAHEKLNDGKKGDGKLYPALGGATLINKLLAEMDIVAHIERVVTSADGEEKERWIGQIQPRDNIVCKDGTNALGDRRIADLTRWFSLASESLAPDEADVPFSDDFAGAPTEEQIARWRRRSGGGVMLSIPFFSSDDADRIARFSWEYNVANGLTEQSWAQAEAMERERADYVVLMLNQRMCTRRSTSRRS
jgi:hypothetical protein